MIFAAETEERALHVFPDAETAASYCEGMAVEAMLWLFWDDNGWPMAPQFTTPNKRGLFTGQNGVYHLVPAADSRFDLLQVALKQVRHVVGEFPFTSVRAVQDYLNGHAPGAPQPG